MQTYCLKSTTQMSGVNYTRSQQLLGFSGCQKMQRFAGEVKFAGLKGQAFNFTNQLLYQLSYAGDTQFNLVFVEFSQLSRLLLFG